MVGRLNDTYVGIDQSYSGFGLAFYWPNSGQQSEVLLKGFDPKKAGTGAARLLTIQHWFASQIRERVAQGRTIVHICMEGYNRGARNGREESGELAGAVKLALLDTLPAPACYPTIVPPTSLKKFVTSRGNASKAEMLLGVYKKWGADFRDDNQADAYGLARLAYVVENMVPQHKYEEEVLDQLKAHTELTKH